MARRFLIDTDTASDDAVALLMALRHPGVDVEAITVVAGNVQLDLAVQNALYTRDELLTHDVADFTDGGIDRAVLRSPEMREGARIVHRKDGHSVVMAFVVTPTRVANLAFSLAMFWELAADDPRAAGAV